MTKNSYAQGLSVLAFVLVGCSAAPDTGTDSDEKKAPTSKTTPPTKDPVKATDPTTPTKTESKEVCSAPGTKGNNLGIGEFCSKTQRDCPGDTFCQADFAPEGAQFCTLLCTSDAQCGSDAVCFKEARGSACVPNKCLAK